ncbi:hypothetical protein V6N11_079385 [Hibiscus sabdariffa]|uniref:F-box domain-containing protein n=1 Tax=Hibiscus sabdariffa TaxID=183260 RepID=A0ABR2RVI2_9ROSI
MMKMEEEDRISSLPDEILAHILSFLELRDAFRTCLLSRRWEKIWTLTQTLNLNLNSSMGEESIDFINKVSTLHDRILPVKSFSLSCKMGCSYYFFHKKVSNLMEWMGAVTTQNFEKFSFRIACGGMFPAIKMPPALFQCQKLVTLNLDCTWKAVICLDVPETVCFSSLKNLRLAKVLLEDENKSLTNLFSGCPVLEELYVEIELSAFDFKQNRKFSVVSPSLKILRWKRRVDSECFGSFYVVEAPKLEFLDIEEHSLLGFSMSASPSLVSAVIHIRSALCYSSTISLMELFQAISNVRRLELSTLHKFMVKEELDNLPEFCDLIHLKVGSCVDWHFVDSILQHSPHLKHLIFDKDHFVHGPLTWRPPESVPLCLVSRIETIEIVAAGDPEHTDYVTEMILYLLQNGKVLKKMVITPFACKDFLMELRVYPKASIGCKIEFSEFPNGDTGMSR